jgi:hypothetical protein
VRPGTRGFLEYLRASAAPPPLESRRPRQQPSTEGGGAVGAVMLGDEMIDEASRKMALVISAKGRAAGMQRTQTFTPPEAA